ALWATEAGNDTIARIDAATGAVTELRNVVPAGSHPGAIVLGPDGNLWFVNPGHNTIGRLTPQWSYTEFRVASNDVGLKGIAVGPDGNLWFTESNADRIGRITPQGAVTEFTATALNHTAPRSI